MIDTVFYQGGQVKAYGLKANSEKDGIWYFLYPDGTLMAIENYQEGKIHGEARNFDFSGNLQALENYCHGLIHDSAFYYHPQGHLQKKGRFEEGLSGGLDFL